MSGGSGILGRRGGPAEARARPTDWQTEESFENATLARSYPTLYEEQTPLGQLFRDRVELVIGFLSTLPEGKILDAGCGAGLMTTKILETRPGEFAVTALDRSRAMIETAKSVVGEHGDASFVVARIEEMPFAAGAFDAVLALGVLEYVPDLDATLREVARVVRPGGVVIVSMQNPLNPWRLWERHVYDHVRRMRRGDGRMPIELAAGERKLRRGLHVVGLEPIDVVYYNFNVFLSPLDLRHPRGAMAVSRRLGRLQQGSLRRLGGDYVVLARRGD